MCLLILPICSCLSKSASIKALNILIKLILNWLFKNSKSVPYLSLFLMFPLPLQIIPPLFFTLLGGRLNITYQAIRSEMNNPLDWDFMLIWLWIWLYFIIIFIIVVVDVKGFKFLKCLCFTLPCFLGDFPKNSFLNWVYTLLFFQL